MTSNYTYDQIYELTQAMQGTSTTESYSYDPVGNRTSSLGIPSYTVNSSNELAATSTASAVGQWRYAFRPRCQSTHTAVL